MRAIFAAQLASYQIRSHADKEPLIALGFSDQALDDAYRGMRVLKGYFRPHYIAGTIHEHRGNALTALKLLVRDATQPANGRLVESYGGKATQSFNEAHREFDEALKLLDQSGNAANERADELRLEYRIRSLKAALRGSNASRVLDQMNGEFTWATLTQHYNVACLYAVASAAANNLGHDGQELASRCYRELVAVISEEPSLAGNAESDSDLLLILSPKKLRDLAQNARGTATENSCAQP